MRATIEGSYKSTDAIPVRDLGAEAIGDSMRLDNANRLTGVAFVREFDRVH